ncbi:MAG: hypothetical protein U5K32_06525 [Bacteroidales bacterium]|nr:hypothetical protein [Bacteroidales bacterium]
MKSKKLLVIIGLLFAVTASQAQDLEKIIERHIDAINAEKLTEFKSLTVKGSLMQQGMQLNLLMYEKSPDKIKIVTSLSDMEIVQVVNGDRGYTINPMTGSASPVPMTPAQISSMKDNSMLQSSLLNQYRAGEAEIIGEEEVNGKAAYKIKVPMAEADRYIFIDKESFYITRVRMTVEQMGMEMTVDMQMEDFEESSGVILARTINTYINGQPGGRVTYESIDFNTEIDDSEFIIK